MLDKHAQVGQAGHMDKQVSARRVVLLDGDAEAFVRRTGDNGLVELVIVGADGQARPVLVALLPDTAWPGLDTSSRRAA